MLNNFCVSQLSGSSLDLIVTSTERNIGEVAGHAVCPLYHDVFSISYCAVMVEGVGREVAEDTFCEAVLFAHEEVRCIELCVSRY